jgi:hypothetical protein
MFVCGTRIWNGHSCPSSRGREQKRTIPHCLRYYENEAPEGARELGSSPAVPIEIVAAVPRNGDSPLGAF